MKTIEELITELLVADDGALVIHTEETLQHIINHFSNAAKSFHLIISLKKTEVLYKPPLSVAYSPPHISIDSTNLNAVEHFTYLGSVISNDATVSKDLDNHLSNGIKTEEPAVPLEDCQREHGRATRSASPQSSRYTGSSSLPPSCMVRRPGFSIGNRLGYWSGFTNAACAPSLASNGKTTCRTQKSSTVCFRCSCAGLATSQEWKTFACPKQSSSASSKKKESAIVVLQESVTKIS